MRRARGARAGCKPLVAAFVIGCPGMASCGSGSSTSDAGQGSSSDAAESSTGDTSDSEGVACSERPTEGNWTSRASLPTARREVGVVALPGQIYVIGGFEGAQAISRVERYDPASDGWAPAVDLPVPWHHPNVAVVEGRIVVAGFSTGVDFCADGTEAFGPTGVLEGWFSGT